MADVHQIRSGTSGANMREAASRARSANYRGTELSQARDVDDIRFQSLLRAKITGKPQARQATALQTPTPLDTSKVQMLSLRDLTRHAKVSGNAQDVNQRSLQFLRRRLLRQKPGSFTFSQAERGGAMRQYLALQKMQAAAMAQQAARQRSASEAEAEDEFMAAMAPVSDHPGNAAALAQRFYDAINDEPALHDLLSGFEDKQRTAFIEALRDCAVEWHYDDKQQGMRASFNTSQFCTALKRAMQLDHYRVTDQEARDLLDDTQVQLATMEDNPDFHRFMQGALNIVSVAEELHKQGENAAQFIENYTDLVHADASLASKCKRAAELYVREDGSIDPEQLRMQMEAASRAANLDMESTHPSHTDKAHLWAAVQSAKLIARLSTAVMLAQSAAEFLQRQFGRDIPPGKLLHELLERMSNPYSSPQAFMALAERLEMNEDALPATLKQASDFFRDMLNMYPDEQSRQALLQNVLDAMDEAARMEDERLGQVDSEAPIPIAAPAQASIPAALDTDLPWTGFSKR